MLSLEGGPDGVPKHSVTCRFLTSCRKEFKISLSESKFYLVWEKEARMRVPGDGVKGWVWEELPSPAAPLVSSLPGAPVKEVKVHAWTRELGSEVLTGSLSSWDFVCFQVWAVPGLCGTIVSAFWLERGLVPNMVCLEVLRHCPFPWVSIFIITMASWALGLVSGEFFLHLGLIWF